MSKGKSVIKLSTESVKWTVIKKIPAKLYQPIALYGWIREIDGKKLVIRINRISVAENFSTSSSDSTSDYHIDVELDLNHPHQRGETNA